MVGRISKSKPGVPCLEVFSTNKVDLASIFQKLLEGAPFFIFCAASDFACTLHLLEEAIIIAVTMYDIPLGHIIQLAESQCGHSTVRLPKSSSVVVDPVT
jgi:hypothetical protein